MGVDLSHGVRQYRPGEFPPLLRMNFQPAISRTIEIVADFRLGFHDAQMVDRRALDAGRAQINANEQSHKCRPLWPLKLTLFDHFRPLRFISMATAVKITKPCTS